MIILKLKPNEAKAMLYALGNSTEHPDVIESLFPNPVERASAYRGEEKLRSALYGHHSTSSTVDEFFTKNIREKLRAWRRQIGAPSTLRITAIELGYIARRHHTYGVTWSAEYSGGSKATGWVSLNLEQFDMDRCPDV